MFISLFALCNYTPAISFKLAVVLLDEIFVCLITLRHSLETPITFFTLMLILFSFVVVLKFETMSGNLCYSFSRYLHSLVLILNLTLFQHARKSFLTSNC